MTLSIGGFSRVVTFPTAPIATGRSDPCREGLAPSQEPCLSTAHDYAYANPPYGPSPGSSQLRGAMGWLEPAIGAIPCHFIGQRLLDTPEGQPEFALRLGRVEMRAAGFTQHQSHRCHAE
jgi:hypothetical protein